MSKSRKLALVVIAACLFALAYRGCDGGGLFNPPPFKTDRLAVVVIEETEDRGKLSADALNILAATDGSSIKALVESRGGEFHTQDRNTQPDQNSPAWLREAFALPREREPWVHAATPNSGFSMALPSEAELRQKIEGLK